MKKVVAAREYYRWELEFPSRGGATQAMNALREAGFDCYQEGDLVFTNIERTQCEELLRKLSYESSWLTLDQQCGTLGSELPLG